MRSIVVGTDGSETAMLAVRAAGELARPVGARVNVVSVYEPLTGVRMRGGIAAGREAQAWSVDPAVGVRAVLDKAAGALHATGVDVAVHARGGDAAEALIEVAEELEADLIVVGNRGMQDTRRFLLGSVPDKVSHHAPCSVLIVRTT